jgi:hypothetical protein
MGDPRGGGALYSASYPLKPHSLAAALRDDVRRCLRGSMTTTLRKRSVV